MYQPEVRHFYEEGANLGDKEAVEAVAICHKREDAYSLAMKYLTISWLMPGTTANDDCDLKDLMGDILIGMGDRINAAKRYYQGFKLSGFDAKKSICLQETF